MLLLNLLYGVGVTFPDKVPHFGISDVRRVEESLKSKQVDDYIECIKEVILVDFFC